MLPYLKFNLTVWVTDNNCISCKLAGFYIPCNIDINLLTYERVSVNWRTALTYDATQALIAAIRNNPTRNGVQRSLRASNFSVTGSTGIVSFRPTGDREAAVQLVMVKPTKNGYQFKPLEFGNW